MHLSQIFKGCCSAKSEIKIEAEEKVNWFQRCRRSKGLLVFVISVGAFLDSMLISTVVPILPQYIHDLEHPPSYQAPLHFNDTFLAAANETRDARHNSTIHSQQRGDDQKFHTLQNGTRSPTNETNVILSSTAVPDVIIGPAVTNYSQIQRNKEYIEESTELGILFASKPFIQLLVNPVVGRVTNEFGNRRMMLCGFVVMFLSTLLYGFGELYEVLLVARSLQGVASSFTSIGGMTMLADTFTDEKKRQYAMGMALGGLGLGLSVGPPFGGATYQYIGKIAPFLILCGFIFLTGSMLAFTKQPPEVKKKKDGTKQTSISKLARDPYIMIATGGIFLTCACYAFLETVLPIWMMETMNPSRFQIGIVFMPYPLFFLFVTTVLGKLCTRVKRWLLTTIGVFLTGAPLLVFPFCTNTYHILVPSAIMGVGAALVDIALMPEIAHLIDIRHKSAYSNVYAISDIAVCLGAAIGPTCAGFIFKKLSFVWMMVCGSAICFVYLPTVPLLRNPPVKNLEMAQNKPPAPKDVIQNNNDYSSNS